MELLQGVNKNLTQYMTDGNHLELLAIVTDVCTSIYQTSRSVFFLNRYCLFIFFNKSRASDSLF